MRKLSKLQIPCLSKFLEINKTLVTMEGPFNQEKWLNSGKNSELGGVLTCSSLIPNSLAPMEA